MKFLLPVFLLVGNCCLAQKAQEEVDVENIANYEMQAHQHSFNNFISGTAYAAASNNFDVNYYRCEWQIDPSVRYINGKITVYFKPTSATNSITLDMMQPLVADSIKYHGSPVNYSQPPATLQIDFANSLSMGVQDSVSIWYKGVPANTGFGSFILSSHAGVPVFWSLSESYGARDWWPCKNGINDKADSVDIIITHPNIYKAASNGLLQSETPLGTDKTITFWKHRYPIATYLICAAITNYVTFNNTVTLGNVTLPMFSYSYPENVDVWKTNTPNVLQSMQLFHNTFGDYPFIKEGYGHTQFGFGGGMEHQANSFLNNTGESLMAHELGHQWFGDKITCSSWEDIWLNEGFATHLAAYHMETKYPENAISNRRILVNNITSQPTGSVRCDDTLSLSRIFSQRLSYNKGSHLLFMLRFILGDRVFFAALRRYQADPALKYGNATTADLKRNLQAESGKDLTYFFDQWYTGQGYPTYTVKWNMVGKENVDITMDQITSHPSVSFFKLPVALKFKNATQEKTVVVDNTFSGQAFIKNIGFVADTVLVDPEYWLISRNNSMQRRADRDSIVVIPIPVNTGEGIVEINPNPVTNPFTIYLHDFKADAALVSIYNKLGQRIFAKNVALINGMQTLKVPSVNWQRGVYIVTVKAGDKQVTTQIIR